MSVDMVPVDQEGTSEEIEVSLFTPADSSQGRASVGYSDASGGFDRTDFEWIRIVRVFTALIQELESFERKFPFDSETFYRLFQAGEITEEREEFYDWRSTFVAYQRMRERFGLQR